MLSLSSCKKIRHRPERNMPYHYGLSKEHTIEKLYILSGLSPPHIRRMVLADWERTKMEMDTRHVMHTKTTTKITE